MVAEQDELLTSRGITGRSNQGERLQARGESRRRDQTMSRSSWTSASLLHNTLHHRHSRTSATASIRERTTTDDDEDNLRRNAEGLFSNFSSIKALSCGIHPFSFASYSPLAYGGLYATLRSRFLPTRLPFLSFHDDLLLVIRSAIYLPAKLWASAG
jgi:hypothetical protein